jgi:hypothetical protein
MSGALGGSVGWRDPASVAGRRRGCSFSAPDNWYFAKKGLHTVETEKPARPVSSRVSTVTTTLSFARPEGWIIPCIAMLD